MEHAESGPLHGDPHGYEIIGLENNQSFIESGKPADLVILAENPLENIRNTNTVQYVMKNGRLYDADTLDEIAPRQREVEPFPWADDAPEAVPGIAATGN